VYSVEGRIFTFLCNPDFYFMMIFGLSNFSVSLSLLLLYIDRMAPTRSRKTTVPHFNVMVVGFSGVGKTSFVRTLQASLGLNKRDSMFQSGEQASCPLLERTLEPYTMSVETLVDGGEKVALTLIDTPGFNMDYLLDKQVHDILGYIEHQFDLTLAEVKGIGAGTLCHLPDHH
jgi:septin family protein